MSPNFFPPDAEALLLLLPLETMELPNLPGELSYIFLIIVCDNLSLIFSEGEANEAPVGTVLRCFTGDRTGVINLSLFPLPLLLLMYIG